MFTYIHIWQLKSFQMVNERGKIMLNTSDIKILHYQQIFISKGR